MAARWNPPPNWPPPPSADWRPPQGWEPSAEWGPAPDGWQFWVEEGSPAPQASSPTSVPVGPAAKSGNWFGRHKVLTGLGTVVSLMIIIGALSGGGDTGDKTAATTDTKPDVTNSAAETPQPTSAPTNSSQTTKAADKSASELGKKVRDGKFEFTVTKIKCGRTLVGSSSFGKKAQGEFCEVSLAVENIGDEPQSLFGDNQYLFDNKDRKFSADTEAAIYLEDANTLYEEINPGNKLKGTLIFDVPKGTKPAKLELHDSILSGGVDVRL